MPDKPSFTVLRARAFDLADTGRYNNWMELADELELEGFSAAATRLRSDPVLLRMLDARCQQAMDRSS